MVRVLWNANGLPIAITRWPTRRLLESPSSTRCNASGGTSILITAKSLEGSAPTTMAGSLAPSAMVTPTSSAPSTTWKLVTMCPSWS